MANFPVQLTATGANPLVQTLDTDANGAVTFVYRGNHPGTDALHATALGLQTSIDSPTVSVAWTDVSDRRPDCHAGLDRLALRQHFESWNSFPSFSRRASP